MKVVSGLVAAFMSTARAGNYVVSVENALALCQIGEQHDRRLAFVTSHDDVPGALLRLNHWELGCRGRGLGAGRRTRVTVSVFSQKTIP